MPTTSPLRSALEVPESKTRLAIGCLPALVLLSLGFYLALIDGFCLVLVFSGHFPTVSAKKAPKLEIFECLRHNMAVCGDTQHLRLSRNQPAKNLHGQKKRLQAPRTRRRLVRGGRTRASGRRVGHRPGIRSIVLAGRHLSPIPKADLGFGGGGGSLERTRLWRLGGRFPC